MKYNSIGEQLIAKAQELDPNYKPDKFNDMSEALDVILNNTGSGSGSSSGKPILDISSYVDFDNNTITQEGLDLIYTKLISNEIVGVSFGAEGACMLLNEFGEEYLFFKGPYQPCPNGFLSIGLIINNNLSIETKDYSSYLSLPTTSPTSQVIPSITTSNTQQNLTIGDGLEIKGGALISNLHNFKYGTLCLNNITQGDATLNIELSFFDYIYDSIINGANLLLGTSLTRDTFPQYIKQNKSIDLIISLIDNTLTLIRTLSMMPYFNITVCNDISGTYYYNCPIKKDGSSISLFLGNQEMILNTSLTFDDTFTVEYKTSWYGD